MSPLAAAPAHDLNWLITNFADRVPSVAHAIVVSADGLPLAFSSGFPQDRADQLAAVTSGLISLTQGASRVFEGGPVTQTVVEMRQGLLLVMAISDGSSLAVLCSSDCDMGLVAYEQLGDSDEFTRCLHSVGECDPATKFSVAVSPGHHVFVIWSENSDALVADLLPNKHYFVEVSPTEGWTSSRVHLIALTPRTDMMMTREIPWAQLVPLSAVYLLLGIWGFDYARRRSSV